MEAGKLICILLDARDKVRGIIPFYVGKPYTASTVCDFNREIHRNLESLNYELRQELGIELYMDVIPTLSNCGVEGYLKVRKCTEHKEDVKWVEQRGVGQKEKTKKPKLLHTILQKLS